MIKGILVVCLTLALLVPLFHWKGTIFLVICFWNDSVFPLLQEPRLVQEKDPLNPRSASINRVKLATKDEAGDDEQKGRWLPLTWYEGFYIHDILVCIFFWIISAQSQFIPTILILCRNLCYLPMQALYLSQFCI